MARGDLSISGATVQDEIAGSAASGDPVSVFRKGK